MTWAPAASDAASDFIAGLDSIEQRKRLLDQELAAVMETARARFSSLDDSAASALFSELYWSLPDITTNKLTALFGRSYHAGHGALKVSPIPTGVHCAGCGIALMAGSRAALRAMRSRCEGCEKSRQKASSLEWREREARYEERQRDLRSMPYSLYLQSPEWQATRGAALKRARYACQLCKRTDTILDVHHNTYERRGQELASDLLVVCRGCHEKHHDRLPVEAQS